MRYEPMGSAKLVHVNMFNFIKIKLGKKYSKKRKRERSLHFCMQAKQLQKKYNLDQPKTE